MKAVLEKLFDQRYLERSEAKEVLLEITSGSVSDAAIGAFLSVFNMRPVSAEEMLGFRDALICSAVPLNTVSQQVMDICGTGGDGKDTFNISTATAFLVAACDQKVLKHGNSAVSSKCGSSDVLSALGITFPEDSQRVRDELDRFSLSFLHAPLWHPTMRSVGSARKGLGVRTIFNLLGPLANPAQPTTQICGVSSIMISNLYEEILQRLDCKYGVIFALDGYDECSLTAQCLLKSWRGTFTFSAEDLGFERIAPSALKGGESPQENAQILASILNGNGTEAQMQVVAANAAIALFVADKAASLAEAAKEVKQVLFDGTPGQLLETIRNGGRR